jgi:hypothetical protein
MHRKQIPATIVDHGFIRNAGDFLRLNLVDWARATRSHWKSEQDAIDRIAPVFVNRFGYKIVDLDLDAFPERDDFPGWKHVGNHEEIGRLYWNHFKHDFPDSDLHFHDSPDFSGIIRYTDQRKDHYPYNEFYFYGDIGKVSPVAILDSMHAAVKNTLWITVVSEQRQIILEPTFDPTPTTLKITELLEPYETNFHMLENDVVLKIKEKNYFLGKENDIAQMTPQQIKKLLAQFGIKADPKKLKGKEKTKPPMDTTQLKLF